MSYKGDNDFVAGLTVIGNVVVKAMFYGAVLTSFIFIIYYSKK